MGGTKWCFAPQPAEETFDTAALKPDGDWQWRAESRLEGAPVSQEAFVRCNAREHAEAHRHIRSQLQRRAEIRFSVEGEPRRPD